jgi:uncharacterized protein YlaI
MEWFILWLAFSLIPAVIASKRGRSGIGWFFLGTLISPLIATVVVLALDDLSKKKCPACGENIPVRAQVCPFCRKDLGVPTAQDAAGGAAEFKPDSLDEEVSRLRGNHQAGSVSVPVLWPQI